MISVGVGLGRPFSPPSPPLPSSLSCHSLVALRIPRNDFLSISKIRSHLPVFCTLPARDIVIDFGKYRGSMMGTLPSKYLNWLSRELRQGRLSIWADYAEEVLQDPYYRDRLEWEKVEKLTGGGDVRRGRPPAGDINVLDPMKALGWNLEDRTGWSKVNVSALGTTLGGRIPRKEIPDPEAEVKKPRTTQRVKKAASSRASQPDARESESLSLREELLRRRQQRRERLLAAMPKKSPSSEQVSNGSPIFPGREFLLEKARNALDK